MLIVLAKTNLVLVEFSDNSRVQLEKLRLIIQAVLEIFTNFQLFSINN